VAKIGRNDDCWCGSGRKFKKCHLDRQDSPMLNPWNAEQRMRKVFESKICSAPVELHQDCSNEIVRAHTVQRSRNLTKIQRNGHVYSFVTSFDNLNRNNGVLRPTLIGVRKASTFNGFCSHHDAELFAPIEMEDFKCTSEQCFLLGFRALCREIYTKRAQNESIAIMREADKGQNIQRQLMVQAIAEAFQSGAQSAISDNLFHKGEFDKLLLSKNFDDVRFACFYFDRTPDVMCSFAFNPSHDFQGRELQDLSDLDKRAKIIACSTIAFDHLGALIFTWLNSSDSVAGPLIESLEKVPEARKADVLLQMLFEVSENLHLRPEWWEGLSVTLQEQLIRRMNGSANPFIEQHQNPFEDDGQSYVNWKVVKVVKS
jgi:SEC-C motif